MDADLDLLLIAVYCIADDLLPEKQKNARRRISDAEVVTLCLAQTLMGMPSDPRFLRAAPRALGHFFPRLPERTAFHKRRLRLSGAIEASIAEFARHSPGFVDDMLLVDSTPVECARSRETVKRGGQSCLGDALSNAADYGYCASHSRYFWGFRLHALFAMDGTPRALALTSPKIDEKIVCLQMVARCQRQPGQMLILIGDKNFRGKQFEADLQALDATIHRPRRKDEPGKGPHLAPIRQRIESIFWTLKDILDLERHGARTLENLRVRLAARFAALAAAISLNHQLGRPSRSIACYTA
ncbi:MAG: IS982 family transposase [Pseudonocardiales bacterium]|nr:MAG: IS982 family transposase [Pseudonocardiales bacterium]